CARGDYDWFVYW
nr:immunoglobulin heavy chain junction region [Mus musculus]